MAIPASSLPTSLGFLNYLGPVKNPVLLSSSIFSLAMMHFASGLFDRALLIANIVGSILFLLSVVVFLIGLGFYIFAFFRLPSTTQEQVFLQEAQAAFTRHNRSIAKARSRKEMRNA